MEETKQVSKNDLTLKYYELNQEQQVQSKNSEDADRIFYIIMESYKNYVQRSNVFINRSVYQIEKTRNFILPESIVVNEDIFNGEENEGEDKFYYKDYLNVIKTYSKNTNNQDIMIGRAYKNEEQQLSSHYQQGIPQFVCPNDIILYHHYCQDAGHLHCKIIKSNYFAKLNKDLDEDKNTTQQQPQLSIVNIGLLRETSILLVPNQLHQLNKQRLITYIDKDISFSLAIVSVYRQVQNESDKSKYFQLFAKKLKKQDQLIHGLSEEEIVKYQNNLEKEKVIPYIELMIIINQTGVKNASINALQVQCLLGASQNQNSFSFPNIGKFLDKIIEHYKIKQDSPYFEITYDQPKNSWFISSTSDLWLDIEQLPANKKEIDQRNTLFESEPYPLQINDVVKISKNTLLYLQKNKPVL